MRKGKSWEEIQSDMTTHATCVTKFSTMQCTSCIMQGLQTEEEGMQLYTQLKIVTVSTVSIGAKPAKVTNYSINYNRV